MPFSPWLLTPIDTHADAKILMECILVLAVMILSMSPQMDVILLDFTQHLTKRKFLNISPQTPANILARCQNENEISIGLSILNSYFMLYSNITLFELKIKMRKVGTACRSLFSNV